MTIVQSDFDRLIDFFHPEPPPPLPGGGDLPPICRELSASGRWCVLADHHTGSHLADPVGYEPQEVEA